MTNVAVIYYSSTGSVHRLAEAAAVAAQEAGAEVRLRKIAELVPQSAAARRAGAAEHHAATEGIPEATLDDVEWADAILIGTPVHFGLAAPQLMHFINTTSALSIAGELANKVISVFASGSAAHGGQVSAILALHNAVCHWGSIIIATGSTAAVLYKPQNGNPYGASSVVGSKPGEVHADNLKAVEWQARRTMQVAAALVRGKIEEVA